MSKNNVDEWANEILKAVAEAENQQVEYYDEFDFSDTRYSESYEESLLASVY